jgi:hypothetical protein
MGLNLHETSLAEKMQSYEKEEMLPDETFLSILRQIKKTCSDALPLPDIQADLGVNATDAAKPGGS